MADVSFTATAIISGSDGIVEHGTAGEALARGNAVYLKGSDGEYYKADCTSSAATAACVGIALNDAADGQAVSIHTGGSLTCDGLTLGNSYVLHASGAIQNVSATEPASGDYVTLIGVAASTTELVIPKSGPIVTGAQIS